MDQWNQNIVLYPQDRLFKRLFGGLFPKAIKPNHVTYLRMVLTPVVLWLLWQKNYNAGVPLFFVAALTDAVDGSLARTRAQITPWGISLDPFADKLLIGSVLVLIVWGSINRYLGIGLLLIESIIALDSIFKRWNGIILPAELFGKTKMIAEVIGVLLLLFALWFNVNFLVGVSTVVFAVALGAAIISIFIRLK